VLALLSLFTLLTGCGWLHGGAVPQPHDMMVTVQPEAGRSGEPLITQPSITLRDEDGNPVNVPATITLELYGGTHADLTGTTSVSTVDGIATFSGLTLTGTAGIPLTLRATSDANVSPVDLNPVTLAAGTPTRLSITGFEPRQLRNIPFNVNITLLDGAGNPSPAITPTEVRLRVVSETVEGDLLQLAPQDGSVTLSGEGAPRTTIPTGASSGVIRRVLFTGVSRGDGLDVDLIAEADGLVTTDRAPFSSRDITLAIDAVDASLDATGVDSTAVTVTVTDADGHLVSGADITLRSSLGSFETVDGGLVTELIRTTNAKGVVRATLVAGTEAGTAILSASCPGACTVTTEVVFNPPVSLEVSEVWVSPTSVSTSPTEVATLHVALRDEGGALVDASGRSIAIDTPSQGSVGPLTRQSDGTYRATFTPGNEAITSPTDVTLTARVDGQPMAQRPTVTLAVNTYFYLDANGVTIRCPFAVQGDEGVVNGVTYTKYQGKTALRSAIQNDPLAAATACTSGMTLINDLRVGSTFNEDVSHWDTSSATAMNSLFSGASAFNNGCPTDDESCGLDAWDVSNVTDFFRAFENAKAFNQSLASWSPSSATRIGRMFSGATSFNQDLSGWCIPLPEPSDFAANTPSWTDVTLQPSWNCTE